MGSAIREGHIIAQGAAGPAAVNCGVGRLGVIARNTLDGEGAGVLNTNSAGSGFSSLSGNEGVLEVDVVSGDHIDLCPLVQVGVTVLTEGVEGIVALPVHVVGGVGILSGIDLADVAVGQVHASLCAADLAGIRGNIGSSLHAPVGNRHLKLLGVVHDVGLVAQLHIGLGEGEQQNIVVGIDTGAQGIGIHDAVVFGLGEADIGDLDVADHDDQHLTFVGRSNEVLSVVEVADLDGVFLIINCNGCILVDNAVVVAGVGGHAVGLRGSDNFGIDINAGISGVAVGQVECGGLHDILGHGSLVQSDRGSGVDNVLGDGGKNVLQLTGIIGGHVILGGSCSQFFLSAGIQIASDLCATVRRNKARVGGCEPAAITAIPTAEATCTIVCLCIIAIAVLIIVSTTGISISLCNSSVGIGHSVHVLSSRIVGGHMVQEGIDIIGGRSGEEANGVHRCTIGILGLVCLSNCLIGNRSGPARVTRLTIGEHDHDTGTGNAFAIFICLHIGICRKDAVRHFQAILRMSCTGCSKCVFRSNQVVITSSSGNILESGAIHSASSCTLIGVVAATSCIVILVRTN